MKRKSTQPYDHGLNHLHSFPGSVIIRANNKKLQSCIGQ